MYNVFSNDDFYSNRSPESNFTAWFENPFNFDDSIRTTQKEFIITVLSFLGQFGQGLKSFRIYVLRFEKGIENWGMCHLKL